MRNGAPPPRRPPVSTVDRPPIQVATGTPSAPSGPPPEPAAAVDALVPFVHVGDVERSIAFYALLGFEVRDTYEHDGRLDWASLRHADAQLMLAAASAPIDPTEQAVLFYLYTPNLSALREHLVAHHADPGPILDGTPGPKRELRVEDPDGYCLMIAQRDPMDRRDQQISRA